jgi:hypothetical protein
LAKGKRDFHSHPAAGLCRVTEFLLGATGGVNWIHGPASHSAGERGTKTLCTAGRQRESCRPAGSPQRKAVAGYFCWTLVLLYTFVTPSTEWAI